MSLLSFFNLESSKTQEDSVPKYQKKASQILEESSAIASGYTEYMAKSVRQRILYTDDDWQPYREEWAKEFKGAILGKIHWWTSDNVVCHLSSLMTGYSFHNGKPEYAQAAYEIFDKVLKNRPALRDVILPELRAEHVQADREERHNIQERAHIHYMR